MPADPSSSVIVPRPVRRTGRTGAGWPEGLGPELHELLFDAVTLLTPNPRPVNGEWFTEYTANADRVGTALRWARKVAARQEDGPVRDRAVAAMDACLTAIELFPRWRADTLALVATEGSEVVRPRFAGWWGRAVDSRPQLEECILEIERTGWGLEPEGAYRVHVRVWGIAVHYGAGRLMAAVQLLYGREKVPRAELEQVLWPGRTVKPSTFRSGIARMNKRLVHERGRWGRIRIGRGCARLELLPPPPVATGSPAPS